MASTQCGVLASIQCGVLAVTCCLLDMFTVNLAQSLVMTFQHSRDQIERLNLIYKHAILTELNYHCSIMVNKFGNLVNAGT